MLNLLRRPGGGGHKLEVKKKGGLLSQNLGQKGKGGGGVRHVRIPKSATKIYDILPLAYVRNKECIAIIL